MSTFLQSLIDSLAVGCLYALIALGYTMVYGTLKFINFAHGSIVMLGAWFSFIIASRFGWTGPGTQHPALAAAIVLPLVMLICSVLGFLIEQLAYRPLRSAPRLNVLITAIGVALLIENTSQLQRFIGTQPKKLDTLLPDHRLATIAEVNIGSVDVMIIVLAFVFMAALQYLVFGTQLGSAMRAVSQDPRTATLMGISVNRTISITFVVGSALAAIAGFLFANKYGVLNQPAHQTWLLFGLKAFVAAVVGGIGNIRGAMVGGLLIGIIETFGAAYLNPQFRDVYVFALLIGVLLFLPSGIFGKGIVEKV